MSKGIVMEKHRQFTIIMTSDGNFQKVKPLKDAEIGAEVSYELMSKRNCGLSLVKSHRMRRPPMRYIAIACMALLLVMPFYLLGDQNETYAFVSLDINPSIEIEIDSELNVVAISPLNDDAQKLLKKLPTYRGKKVAQVIEVIMNKSDKLGLTENGKNVLVGVSYTNDQADNFLEKVDLYFIKHKTSWNIATFQVPREVRELALEQNISMNKVMADTMSEKVTNQSLFSDDEKEIIHSFYATSKSNHQGTNEIITDNQDETNNPAVLPRKNKTQQHPSELKKQNGQIHSNGKKQYKRNKTEEAKEERKDKREKEKDKDKHKKEKDKHKKAKDKHKHKKAKEK